MWEYALKDIYTYIHVLIIVYINVILVGRLFLREHTPFEKSIINSLGTGFLLLNRPLQSVKPANRRA